MSDTTSFKVEHADINFAQWILSLPNDVLRDLIWKDKEDDNGEGIKDPDVHMSMLQKYLEELIVGDGHVTRKYDYSERTPNVGRRSIGKGFGLQFCKKSVRGPLAAPFYNDFDMINCHPTIILHLVKTYMPPSFRVPYLTKYIENREKILKENNVTKRQINSMINKGWYDDTIDIDALDIHNLDNEIKQIQHSFHDNLPEGLSQYSYLKDVLKKDKKGNVKARFLGMLAMIFEDKILRKAEKEIGSDNVAVLMYDGFFVKKDLPIDETIEKLNKVGKKYGIKWCHKPHDLTLKIDEDLCQIKSKSQLGIYDYEYLKEDFEKEFKLIRNPTVFVNLYPGIGGSLEMGFHSYSDIRILTENRFFKVPKPGGGVMKKSFLQEWMQDEGRASYSHPVFYPGDLPASNQGFNTFTGFNAHKLKCEKRENLLHAFKKCINNLTNNDSSYLIKYIAHIFQKPTELPGIAILFQSEEGFGKDTLRQIVARLIGNKYVHETSNMESIFGSFNSSIANKLLLILNEMEGKNGFTYKERMKALWTSELVELNEKNVKRWKQANYMRAFIYSNNKRPIQIPYDDRRYVVYRASLINASKEFFDSVYALMEEPEEQLGLYDYLMNIDLTDFNIKKRPHTKAYEKIKTANISPVYEFFYDLLNGNIGGIPFYKKANRSFYIGSTLFNKYTGWCAEQHLKSDMNNAKHIATTMECFGVDYKRISINNEKNYCFIVNDKGFTCGIIETKGLLPKGESIDEADFISNGCDEGVE